MKEEKIIANVNNVTRTLIWRYIQTKGITLNKFCLEAKLHQSNIHTFLKGKTVSTATIEKIGKFLDQNK